MAPVTAVVHAILTLIGVVVNTSLVAWAARRLLGIRFSTLRLLLAGLLGYSITSPVIGIIIGGSAITDPRALLWFVPLGVATALLGPMIFLVLAEVFMPSGSLPSPLEWSRATRGALGRTRRYSQVTRALARHGLGGYLTGRWRVQAGTSEQRRRLARSLRLALDECGVTFIKLGQVMATRSDLLPPEFVEELRLLQDRAAGVPWPEVEAALRTELGPGLDAFQHIDPAPLAAASIAQVHAARLRTGEDVVIKVRRPHIDNLVARDLDILRRLARRLERSTGWGRALGAVDLAGGFAVALREELDFRVEAGNLVAVAAGAAHDDRVRVPALQAELCTRRILVMERMRGVPLGGAGPVIAERGLDRAALGRALLERLLRQVMVEGVFHADPHAGNILLLDDGRLGLLDFGSIGRLDAALRRALQRLLLAAGQGDATALCDALLEVVDAPDEIDEAGLERALGAFAARHLGPGPATGAGMFTDLFRIVTSHRLGIPPAVAAVFRAMGTAEGTLAQLAPGFDLVEEARGFGQRRLVEELEPASIERTAMQELTAMLPTLRRLPRRLDRIASRMENGRLAVNVRLLADARERATVTDLLHQVLLTVLSATAGVMAVLLLGHQGGPGLTGNVTLYQFFGYCLLVVCAVLGLRVLVVIFRAARS